MTSPPLLTDKIPAADYGDPQSVIEGDRFWAVVIGIDNYASPKDPSLCGCVSDADSVVQHLIEKMSVPPDRIELLLGRVDGTATDSSSKNLRERDATRANIVDTLLSLSTNSQIRDGDNVLIYFSGHGTHYLCGDYYTEFPASTGTIEALCPMDRDPLAADVDKRIPDISDRELCTILSEICRTKGHHITVILDCCHSGGMTRILGSSASAVARQVKVLHVSRAIAEMFAAGDKTLGKLKCDDGSPRYESIAKGNWRAEEGTHVTLAACQAYELATEELGKTSAYHGIFTEVLLQKFTEISSVADGKLPTYKDIEKTFPSSKFEPVRQYPKAIGKNRDKRLWYTNRDACCMEGVRKEDYKRPQGGLHQGL
ncbi:caspase domain-containing protein [Desarmillaria tabescens]|uniref:Caspase domain-containing protein n=1 Tax=Armillaria tabescens TaxID=1929756 RepID=A0AA39NK87_ARMTA|nr:caspase domain-containing protein [Desarmillaria tabescens]KAK0467155.1 caspase domain-containing protein [Desarmillaria tabescens]